MACQRLGKHAEARKQFDRFMRAMDQAGNLDPELEAFRGEAEALLGLKRAAPAPGLK